MLHKTGIVCKSLVEAKPILNRKLCRFADPAERECKACHTGDLQKPFKIHIDFRTIYQWHLKIISRKSIYFVKVLVYTDSLQSLAKLPKPI